MRVDWKGLLPIRDAFLSVGWKLGSSRITTKVGSGMASGPGGKQTTIHSFLLRGICIPPHANAKAAGVTNTIGYKDVQLWHLPEIRVVRKRRTCKQWALWWLAEQSQMAIRTIFTMLGNIATSALRKTNTLKIESGTIDNWHFEVVGSGRSSNGTSASKGCHGSSSSWAFSSNSSSFGTPTV